MNKFLIAVAVVLTTVTSAHAWGPREQGALAGIAATLLFQHVQGHAHTQQQPVYIPQQQPQIILQPQHYPQHYPQQQPRVIIQQPQPQVIIIQQGGWGHRRGHYNGGHYDGYYQRPDPNVYNPQMR
jgi:hypothetical protein